MTKWRKVIAVLRSVHVGGAAVVIAGALLAVSGPAATAQPCPDVEVVFARGTGEPPGVGGIGQTFPGAKRWLRF